MTVSNENDWALLAKKGDYNSLIQNVDQWKTKKDKDGWTALMHAVNNSYEKCVELLSKHECTIKRGDGTTALLIAVQNNYFECIDYLKSEYNICDNNGMSALHYACAHGFAECMEKLLKINSENKLKEQIIKKKDNNNWTALMYAAKAGFVQGVQALVNAEGGEINNDNMTALMIAIQFNKISCIPLLSSELCITSNGPSAILLACQSKNKACQSIIFNMLIYEISVKENNMEVKKQVFDDEKYKKLVKKQDNKGWTALMHATLQGIKTQVQYLSKHELRMQNNDGETALFIAIKNNRISCVSYLKDEADIKTTNDMTPLHQIFNSWTLNSKQIDEQCVNQLIFIERIDQQGKKFLGVDENTLNKMIKQQDKSQMTALMYAARSGTKKWVEFLAKYELNIKQNFNVNALMVAAQNGNYQCIEPLKTLIGEKITDSSLTALHYACKCGSVESVRQLIAEATIVDAEGMSGLMFAARQGYLQCVEILAKYEINLKNKKGQTALMLELDCVDEVPSCISLLKAEIGKCVSHNDQKTELQAAASQGHKQCILKLLTNEFDVVESGKNVKRFEIDENVLKTQIKHQDTKGNTALMYLAMRNLSTWVELLVKYESEMQNLDGNTALYFAAESGSEECVKLLLSEIKLKNKEEETALMAAAGKNQYNCIPHLLALKGMINKQGKTALHIAAQRDFSQCIMLLQCEMNIKDSNGNTALMIAAQTNHPNCISNLKGELKQKNIKGQTALHIAVEAGNTNCVSLLKEEKDIQNAEGLTPLQLAKQLGRDNNLVAELERE